MPELSFRRRLQNLSSETAAAFGAANPAELDALVAESLAKIAGVFGLDVYYCALVDEEHVTAVWEWADPVADGVGRTEPGQLLEEAFASALLALRMGCKVAIDDVARLSLTPDRRARLRDVRSLLLLPIRREGVLVAVIGAMAITDMREWSQDDCDYLTYFGRILLEGCGRTQIRSELAVARARTRRVGQMLADGLVTIDRHGRITWTSPNIAAVLGFTGDHLQGRLVTERILTEDLPELHAQLVRVRAGEAGGPVRVRAETASGDTRWFEIRPFQCEHDEELPDEVGLSITDVHDRLLEAENLMTQAMVDGLTGVLNRVGLRRELDLLVDRSSPVGLAFVDLDEFKPVNDRFGHDVGDQVLATIGARLNELARCGAVGRLGGDEFVVAFSDVTAAEARRRAVAVGEAISAPIRTDRGTVNITASIGVVWTPALDEVNALIRSADEAMYVAKRRGRNNVELVEQVPAATALAALISQRPEFQP